MHIRVIKIADETEKIYEGKAIWRDGLIQFQQTTIMYALGECVIKKESDLPAYMLFIENEKTVHQFKTEFGKIQLNVFTEKIRIAENMIELEYQLEDQKQILRIERIVV